MSGRDELPVHMRDEGFSLRDAGLTLAEASSAVGMTAVLVDLVGLPGLLAFPLLIWLFLGSLRAQPKQAGDEVPWLPQASETEWLDDAHASRARGTHISTLAVRYDVNPEWLGAELDAHRPST